MATGAVLCLLLADGAACQKGGEEKKLGNLEGHWSLRASETKVELFNSEKPYHFLLLADRNQLIIVKGDHRQAIPTAELAPSRQEDEDEEVVTYVAELRAAFWGSNTPTGEVSQVGQWWVLATPSWFAFKHESWPFALSTFAHSIGSLFSIDETETALIYSSRFKPYLPSE